MCELKVVVNEKQVFENAIYAKASGTDVFGKTMEFKNHKIFEINITKEQLTLAELE